jgi:polygalacturonase
MVFFCRCTNVTVRDVRLVNSPYWTLLLLGCTRARIRGLSISNPPQTPNGDGIDIDCCREVTVSDCIVTSGDDSITLRAHSALLGEHAQACRDVTITNCVLSTPCNAVRVGVGDGEIRNCTLSNLIIDDTQTLKRAKKMEGVGTLCRHATKTYGNGHTHRQGVPVVWRRDRLVGEPAVSQEGRCRQARAELSEADGDGVVRDSRRRSSA